MKNYHSPLQQQRRGTIIIIAMIALAFASTIMFTMVKTGLTQYRQAKREQLRIQASWLAEAGLERAFSKWQNDKTYKGETWNIPAKDLSGKNGGEVLITMTSDSKITVKATYPTTGTNRAVVSRIITINK